MTGGARKGGSGRGDRAGRGDHAGRGEHAGGATSALDRWWRARSGRARDTLAVGLLGLLTVVFFASFLFRDRMLFGTDIIPMGYAARKLFADFVRAHHAYPLWNPYILGGLPFAEALHGDIFYPASLLYLFLPVHRAIGMKLVLHVFVAGAAMYVYLRGLGLRRGVAAAAGVAYMFAPYFISLIYAGHDAKMYVTALFPLLLHALEKMAAALRGERGAGGAGAGEPGPMRTGAALRAVAGGGLITGLMLLSSHVQMAYFALWGGACYLAAILVRGVRADRAAGRSGAGRRALAVAAGGVVLVGLGLAVGLVQLLPSYLYTREFSPRAGGVDYSFAASWSLHPEEVVSLAVPEFGGYQDSYWGRNPFKLNAESPGALVLFLALGALLARRRWPAWPAFAIGLFALAYALGAHTPLHRLLFALAPGVKFFRAPSIIMFLFSWAAVTLAALGLDHALEGGAVGGGATGRGLRARGLAAIRQGPPARLFLLLAALWWVGFIIAAAARGGLFEAWCSVFYRDIGPSARQTMQGNVPAFLGGAALAGILLAAAAAAFRWGRALGRGVVVLVVMVLLCAGDWQVGRHFVKPVRLEDYVVEDTVVKALEADHDLFRVFPLTGQGHIDQNYLPIFGIQTANGFHDNRMASYDRLLNDPGGVTLRLLAFLNAKYVLTRDAPAESPVLVPVTRSRIGALSLNRAVLPRAYVVHRYRVQEGEAAVLELTRGQMPLDREVILERDPGVSVAEPPAGSPPETVEVLSYTMRGASFRVRAAADGLLYLGDNWYPAWHAYVDGAEAPLLRANLTFRAVPVGAGDHVVEFRYHAPVLSASLAVSGVSGLLLVGCLAAPYLGRRRDQRAGTR